VASFAGPFGEALQKYAFDLYTRRTGIKVEVQYANPADFLAKMIASRGREAPFDIVCLDDDVTAAAIDAGVVQKLDPKIVTNLQHLYPEAVDKNGYGATLFFYSVGIAYNKNKLKEAGIPEPKAWKDLWDPRLSGHISVPDIINIQGRDFVIAVSRMYGGRRGQAGGRAAAMADRGLPIGFATPSEGAIGNVDTVNLVAGSKYPKEAQELINYMLDPFAQLGMAKLLPTGPSTKLLAAVIEADKDWASKAPVTPEAHRALYLPNWTVFNKNLKRATDHWNRTIQK
jgi:putative spermidine/putrescine transport system substrate-binding protein